MEEMSSNQNEMKKARFLTETLQSESSKSTHLYVLTRDQYSALISQIEEAQKTGNKTAVQQRRLKRFEVVIKDNEKRVILRSSRQNKNLRYFLPIEEIYDVIDQIHQTLNHAGRDKMMAETALNYANITREMVVLYLSMCDTCVQRKANILKAHIKENNTTDDYETLVNSRCQIDIIDFQKKPDGKFKYIMVYQDHKTKFTLLRALETDSPSEIADKLIDIFLTIGAPCSLQSNNRKTIVDEIIHNATILWPELVMLHGEIDNPIGALENINMKIEHYISGWLEDKKSTKWSEALRYVQFMKNREYNPEIKKSPFKAMFGTAPKTGLGTIPLPPELLHAIKAGNPFKPIQPQQTDYSSVDYEESSSHFNIDSENVAVVNSIEATMVKEEESNDSPENCFDVSLTDSEPKYVNVHDSNIAVDSENIEVRAIKREIIEYPANYDGSSVGSEKINVSVAVVNFPEKKFKADHHESETPACVRFKVSKEQDVVQTSSRVAQPAFVVSCSCANSCVYHYCQCRKWNLQCNPICHSNTQCFNKQ